jgi:hypothetical protein
MKTVTTGKQEISAALQIRIVKDKDRKWNKKNSGIQQLSGSS